MPTANAAIPLPDEARATITRTTATRITTMPKTSSKVRPIKGSSRPRIRCHASPMVIVDPNTARPTTTVSMPLSMIAASISTMFPANEDADESSSPPVDSVFSPVSAPMLPVAARGPIWTASAMIWVMTTTPVVRPSVAFGLARM